MKLVLLESRLNKLSEIKKSLKTEVGHGIITKTNWAICGLARNQPCSYLIRVDQTRTGFDPLARNPVGLFLFELST